MSSPQITVKESVTSPAGSQKPESTFGDAPIIAAICLVSAAVLAVWFAFSKRLPTIDEAGHILNSLTYRELFRHPHLFSHHWWYQLLTVNRFYPPLVHALDGFLKAVFGAHRNVDVAALIGFNVVLTGSVFGITRLCVQQRRAAIFSAILINCYPILALINRAFWLDFPLVAMIALALYAVLRFEQKPSWQNALCAGAALGLAAMTKQIAVTYLAFPTIWVLGRQFLAKDGPAIKVKLPDKIATARNLGLVALTAAICAPWTLINAGQAKNIADQCSQTIAHSQTFWGNIGFYFSALPIMMSPWLLAVMPAAVLMVTRQTAVRLAPLALSVAGGLLSISTLTWIFPKPQYEAPILIAIAVASAIVLDRLGNTKSRLARAFPYAYVVVAVVQILCLEFAPYPVSFPPLLAQIPANLKAGINEPRLGMTNLNPQPAQDWGQVWALEEIGKVDPNMPVWLNILSNTPKINVHTFELLALETHSPVKPTTSRKYSIGGDTINFSEKEALYYQWYLVPSDNTYQGFLDEASEAQFTRLKQYLADGGRFRVVGVKPLPDGTKLTLYRQI